MAALAPNSCIQYRELCTREYGVQLSNGRCCSVVGSSGRGLVRRLESDRVVVIKGKKRGEVAKSGAFWQDVSRPTSIDMESINSLEEFEEILRQSQENSQPIVVDWFVLISSSISFFSFTSNFTFDAFFFYWYIPVCSTGICQ